MSKKTAVTIAIVAFVVVVIGVAVIFVITNKKSEEEQPSSQTVLINKDDEEEESTKEKETPKQEKTTQEETTTTKEEPESQTEEETKINNPSLNYQTSKSSYDASNRINFASDDLLKKIKANQIDYLDNTTWLGKLDTILYNGSDSVFNMKVGTVASLDVYKNDYNKSVFFIITDTENNINVMREDITISDDEVQPYIYREDQIMYKDIDNAIKENCTFVTTFKSKSNEVKFLNHKINYYKAPPLSQIVK